jgi:uncharacterized integral membrane protein
VVFLAGIIVFIMQNNTPVTIHFINWHTAQISLALVALIAAMGGALITFLVDGFRAFKTGRKLNELTNYNKKLEREITALKAKNASSSENKKSAT